ncbi:MAG: GlsB/YeaQ/YmgE family stress response membrane protein [Acidimicrobiales bacterium]|nr:GlsB/YeaQ/YmgE family stress response membrane protein [Acidimicrobiales bacterium]HRW36069.1 GlsB/YeaQ/YmgE family stress response membrane protein [Aquihabitans sp.]
MILLGILVFGLGIGWLANVILGNGSHPQDWGPLLVAGFAGSLVGGLLISLLSGDGLALKPSGILGSIVGAVIVLGVWQAVAARKS